LAPEDAIGLVGDQAGSRPSLPESAVQPEKDLQRSGEGILVSIGHATGYDHRENVEAGVWTKKRS